MLELFLGTSKSLTVPSGATHVLVQHEWGDICVFTTATGTYTWTPDSIGVHGIYFLASPVTLSSTPSALQSSNLKVVNGTVYIRNLTIDTNGVATEADTTATLVGAPQYTSVVNSYLSSTEFFNDFPQYEATGADKFAALERKIRLVFNRITQQNFGPYRYKTLRIQGGGGENLELDVPIYNLYALNDQYGAVYTDRVSVSNVSPYFIHHAPEVFWLDTAVDIGYVDRKRDIAYRGSRNFFSNRINFFVTGDFGYQYVPTEITEAMKIIVNDEYSGVADMREQGIKQAQLGDYSYTVDIANSTATGNAHADALLSNFININLGLA